MGGWVGGSVRGRVGGWVDWCVNGWVGAWIGAWAGGWVDKFNSVQLIQFSQAQCVSGVPGWSGDEGK